MTLYLDASVVVAALTSEPQTRAARTVLFGDEVCLVTMWTFVEAASAFSIKVRTEAITLSEQEALLRALSTLEGEHLPLIAITDAHLREAMRHTARSKLNLRGGDALHIAVAASLGATLVTGDGPMSRAAERLGVAVRLLA